MNRLRRDWTAPLLIAIGMSMTLVLLNAGRAAAGDDAGDMPTASLFKPATDGRSYNWAGYVVKTNFNTPAAGAVTEVSGEWRVPRVRCGDDDKDRYSAVWVGIDGHGSGTVQQIGTRQDCRDEHPAYGAFFQMNPAEMVNIPRAKLPVGPGDLVRASVRYLGNDTFELKLRNVTKGRSYTSPPQTRVAARSSAEWVVERPASKSDPGRLLPLARFTEVTFKNASVKVNGNTGDIDDSRWQHRKIAMVDREFRPLASPTSLDQDGDSFTVTWSRRDR